MVFIPELYGIFLFLIYFICSSLYLLIPYLLFVPSSIPLPFGNHKLVFYICESVSLLYIHSFVLYFRFHI